jgi:hypothetical protein
MSDKKISQFAELTTPSADDFLPVVDASSSTTKKIKLSNLPISALSQSKANSNTTDFQGVTETTKLLTGIANSAFASNTNLVSIYIGSSVQLIGSSGFKNCSNLTEAFIADGATSIGIAAFQNCTKLSKDLTFNMPNSVTGIGNEAFDNCLFHGVNLSENLTTIGVNAFNSTDLTGITIPASVTSIGATAFANSTDFTGINCSAPLTAFLTNSLAATPALTIHARASDSTWTAGTNLSIGGNSSVTVIKDL